MLQLEYFFWHGFCWPVMKRGGFGPSVPFPDYGSTCFRGAERGTGAMR